MKIITLPPIKETTDDFERLEQAIKDLLKKYIYYPIMKELGEPKNTISNSIDDLLEAIRTGRISFYRGSFSGRFNSQISKELKSLGAQWDRKTRTWKIPQSTLPIDVKSAISSSLARFEHKLERIDSHLQKILPEEIAGKLNSAKFFDSSLWKVEKDLQATLKNITVPPQLTEAARKRIADEWQYNLKKYVTDFSKEQISQLRKDVQENVFKGNRYESLVGGIQKSFRTTESKAKFLARQETALLMAKFKETRYQDAGIREYKWRSVVGSPKHPVRHRHKELAEMSERGKIFRWDKPPITTEPGEPVRRNNPGEDYNCRCFAVPVVRFK